MTIRPSVSKRPPTDTGLSAAAAQGTTSAVIGAASLAGRTERRPRSGVPAHRSADRGQQDPVRVAPTPVLAGLEGADEGMAGALPVGTGVPPRAAVAAAHVPAGQALAQV